MSTFSFIASKLLNPPTENGVASMVIDKVNKYLYYGQDGASVPHFGKLDIPSMAVLSTVNSIDIASGTGVIDITNGYVYFQNWSYNIVKVRLSDLTVVATISPAISSVFAGAALDSANNAIYWAHNPTAQHTAEKFDISSVSFVDTVDFVNGGGLYNTQGIITGGHWYFSAYPGVVSPGRIKKVQTSDFSYIGELVPNSYDCQGIGTDDVYIYSLHHRTSPTPYQVIVSKISIATFSVVDEIVLTGVSPWDDGRRIIVDKANRYAYVSTGAGYIVQIDLDSFTQVNVLTPPVYNGGNVDSCIDDSDANNPYGYFSEYGSWESYIHKFSLESRVLPISSILMYKFRPVVLK
jgi:hypothetical protein